MVSDALPLRFRDRGLHLPPTSAKDDPGNVYSSTKSLAHSSGRSAHNQVTCLYRTAIAGKPQVVSVTWCKNVMAQGLSVSLDYPTDRYRCSVDFKLWRFWKRQGSKMISMGNRRVEVFWDLSSAKYENGPEPQQNFFLVVACSDQIILLLGDLKNEAMKKFQAQEPLAEVTLLSRKEHVYGKELYATRVQFHEKGPTHDVVIECHVQPLKAEPMLLFHVDNREVIRVTGLMWKFRGNQTVEIDGVAVQVFWDVHNWLFKAPEAHAVFMFNTSMADEKPQKPTEGIISGWIQAPSHLPYHVSTLTKKPHSVSDGIWASVLQWPTDAIFKHGEQTFSIILYAWNYE